MTDSEKIIRHINYTASFLSENYDLIKFIDCKNKTIEVYKVDNHNILVKRDANTHAYSIQIFLKDKGTIVGYLDKEEILATSSPDEKIPF